jgi:hypothetical protein
MKLIFTTVLLAALSNASPVEKTASPEASTPTHTIPTPGPKIRFDMSDYMLDEVHERLDRRQGGFDASTFIELSESRLNSLIDDVEKAVSTAVEDGVEGAVNDILSGAGVLPRAPAPTPPPTVRFDMSDYHLDDAKDRRQVPSIGRIVTGAENALNTIIGDTGSIIYIAVQGVETGVSSLIGRADVPTAAPAPGPLDRL